MICLNCGKHVDDDVRVCPFCGSPIDAADAQPVEAEKPVDPLPIVLSGREDHREKAETPARAEPEKKATGARIARRFFIPVLILSVLSLAMSLLCLKTMMSLRDTVRELKSSQTESLAALSGAVSASNERLDQLDSTLAQVQTEAYEKVASQSISLTKDLTPLVGPVSEGRYNRMFIVTAKGNLNVDTSFDWQRYNEATGGWVSIVFTGDATTNELYGLRLENNYDPAENSYSSTLWANGITTEAEGTYRCVITDAGGITKTSSEAIVEVEEAE